MVFGGLLERLVYYACSMYVDQLESGQSYAKASPAISICLLNHRFFRDTDQAHHRFWMLDSGSGRELCNAMEVHTVELTKYNLDETSIGKGSKLEQWAFLFLHAHEHDAAYLRVLLPGVEFQQAIRTIETISARTEDRQMYDQREKAQRDYEWALSGAREEGHEEGKLVGRIQTLQEVLGLTVSSDNELSSLDGNQLTDLLSTLQQSVRVRES